MFHVCNTECTAFCSVPLSATAQKVFGHCTHDRNWSLDNKKRLGKGGEGVPYYLDNIERVLVRERVQGR
jgi:hypothetical protein